MNPVSHCKRGVSVPLVVVALLALLALVLFPTQPVAATPSEWDVTVDLASQGPVFEEQCDGEETYRVFLDPGATLRVWVEHDGTGNGCAMFAVYVDGSQNPVGVSDVAHGAYDRTPTVDTTISSGVAYVNVTQDTWCGEFDYVLVHLEMIGGVTSTTRTTSAPTTETTVTSTTETTIPSTTTTTQEPTILELTPYTLVITDSVKLENRLGSGTWDTVWQLIDDHFGQAYLILDYAEWTSNLVGDDGEVNRIYRDIYLEFIALQASRPVYVVIVGGPQVVPFGLVASPVFLSQTAEERRKANVVNQTVATDLWYSDLDFDHWSDLVTVDDPSGNSIEVPDPRGEIQDMLGEIPVCRVPDGRSLGLIETIFLAKYPTSAVNSLYIQANALRAYADDLTWWMQDLFVGSRSKSSPLPVLSPTVGLSTADSQIFALLDHSLLDATVSYFVLHGSSADTSMWRGEVPTIEVAGPTGTFEIPGEQPRAFSVAEATDADMAVVFADCCFGGYLEGDPAISDSIALTLLHEGTMAFIGSTRTTYSPRESSLTTTNPRVFVGLSMLTMERMGQTEGEELVHAFNEAKHDYVENKLDQNIALTRSDELTLLESVYYGLPHYPLFPDPASSTTPSTTTPSTGSTQTPSQTEDQYGPGYLYIRQDSDGGGRGICIQQAGDGEEYVVALGGDDMHYDIDDMMSSGLFEAPEGTYVTLVEHHPWDDGWPGRSLTLLAHGGLYRVTKADLKSKGLNDKVSTVVWSSEPPDLKALKGHWDITMPLNLTGEWSGSNGITYRIGVGVGDNYPDLYIEEWMPGNYGVGMMWCLRVNGFQVSKWNLAGDFANGFIYVDTNGRSNKIVLGDGLTLTR